MDIDQETVVSSSHPRPARRRLDGCEITAAGTLVDTPMMYHRNHRLAVQLLTARNGVAGGARRAAQKNEEKEGKSVARPSPSSFFPSLTPTPLTLSLSRP